MERKNFLIDTNIAVYYFGLLLSESSESFVETIRIRRGNNIKLPDAIIAATCIINHCCLVTNNRKDFEKIEGLMIETMELA